MTTFDDQFNNDLPGEINDDFSWILPDGETIEDHIPDFYSDDEDLYSDDPGTTEEGVVSACHSWFLHVCILLRIGWCVK